MNYLTITHCDQVNYKGLRVVLWVAGCSHHCKGCHNQHSWDENAGILFDEAAKEELFKDLQEDWCAGITYSGGDPMFYKNRETIINLAKEIREKFPHKNQCMYTGYTWSQILEDDTMRPILNYIDVVMDGEYVESLRDVDLQWVGSSNQNIIDVKERIARIKQIGVN